MGVASLTGVGTSKANDSAGSPAIVREQSPQYGTMSVLQEALQLVGMLTLQSAPLPAPGHTYVTRRDRGRERDRDRDRDRDRERYRQCRLGGIGTRLVAARRQLGADLGDLVCPAVCGVHMDGLLCYGSGRG